MVDIIEFIVERFFDRMLFWEGEIINSFLSRCCEINFDISMAMNS